MTHRCDEYCTAGWRAGSKCHCTSCGRNFLHVGGFEAHRWHRGGADGCIDPVAVGLQLDQTGFYGTVEGIARQEKSGLLLQKARAARG